MPRFSSNELASQLRRDLFVKKILKMDEVNLSFCEVRLYFSFHVFCSHVFVLFLVIVTLIY